MDKECCDELYIQQKLIMGRKGVIIDKLLNSTRPAYNELGSKEQENLNVSRLIAALAARGIECFRVNNDKHCADVIAHDAATGTNLNLQVKGNRRIVVCDKYSGRGVWMVTWDPVRSAFLLFNHDQGLAAMRSAGWMKRGQNGTSSGAFSDKTVQLLVDAAQGLWLSCDQ